MSEATTPSTTDDEAVPVLDPDLAPAKTEPVLPPDAAGNPAAVFDPEEFQADQRKAQARRLWIDMVETEAQVRQAEIDSSVVSTTVASPDGQGQQVTGVVDDEETAAKIHDAQAKEAVRLRTVASTLIEVNGMDELQLLRERIGELAERKSRFARELALWEDLRDHPDHYGYVMMDGKTPIDHDTAVATCKVCAVSLADVTAELDWYIAVRGDG